MENRKFWKTEVPESLHKRIQGQILRLEVIGVYSSAIYFRAEHGWILMLHDKKYGAVPFGIAMQDVSQWIKYSRICPGMEALLTEQYLVFPETAVNLPIEIHPAWTHIAERPSAGIMAALLHREKEFLWNSSKGALKSLLDSMWEGKETVFSRQGRSGLIDLSGALCALDGQWVERALKGLVGLGPGLTPSFDDFLVGVVFTLQYARHFWREPPRRAILLAEKITQLAPVLTNEISAAYLSAAAAGYEFEILSELFASWHALEAEHRCLVRLESVGNNSGMDMLTGVLYCLEHFLDNMDF